MEPGDIEKVERALHERARRSTGGEIRERPDFLQLTTADARTPWRNGVYRSVLREPPERIVAEVCAHFDSLGLPFQWMVTPSTRPRDLGPVLESAGFVCDATMLGQIASPADCPPPARSAVHVEQVSRSNVRDWVEVSAEGWALAADEERRFEDEILAELRQPVPRAAHFVATWDGKPVGCASLMLMGDFAHLQGGVVLPPYRGRGIYQKLLRTRMAFLRERRIHRVTVHARPDTAGPICRHLGFRPVCELAVYVREPSSDAAPAE